MRNPSNINIPFSSINRTLTKKELRSYLMFLDVEFKETVVLCDSIKTWDFEMATLEEVYLLKDDMVMPKEKDFLIAEAEKEGRRNYEKQYNWDSSLIRRTL